MRRTTVAELAVRRRELTVLDTDELPTRAARAERGPVLGRLLHHIG